MVRSCAAHGCTNRFKRKTEDGDCLTFHGFPKALWKAQTWVDAVRREDLTLERVARGKFALCSQHFLADDFLPYGRRRKLQDFAVPSVFPTHVVRRTKHQGRRWGCMAYSCVYNTFTMEQKEDIPLHVIPKDPARRRQWAIAIRRKTDDGGLWIPSDAATLCSLHFLEEDIDRTGQTVRLREDATPSLFNYSEELAQTRQKRGVRRLLSQKELDEILVEHYQRVTTENSPPSPQSQPSPSQPSPSLPPSDSSPRSVTRAFVRVRRLSAKQSLPSKNSGKSRSRKARVSRYSFSKMESSVEADHQYHQLRMGSQLSTDADKPRQTGEVSSPESQPPPLPPSLPPPSLPPPPLPPTVPEPLQLPAGRLTRYLVSIKNKQHQIHHLQKTYLTLLDKIQFRNSHPDWWSESKAESAPETPLLTLRKERINRDPPLVPIDALSDDTLLPLTPNKAWKAVVVLREQVLDLQLALMNSRIQVLDGELRLQEAKAIHKRYKADVREERKQAQQSQKTTVREVEKRSNERCPVCPELRRKLAVVERITKKKVSRAEMLSKRLEQIFTPMQMRVFRTGKKPRWVEEDVRRAIKLKMCVSHRSYSYIRRGMGIPLPSSFILSRGVDRYKSLQPLYDKMLAENEKKVPKSKAGKDGHSPAVRKRKLDEIPNIPSLEPLAVERPLVKRRKKRSLAPPPQPHGHKVELVSHDALADGVEADAAEASSYRGRTAGEGGGTGLVQPSWAQHARAWEMDEESVDEKTLEEMTRPRETHDARDWSSGASELR